MASQCLISIDPLGHSARANATTLLALQTVWPVENTRMPRPLWCAVQPLFASSFLHGSREMEMAVLAAAASTTSSTCLEGCIGCCCGRYILFAGSCRAHSITPAAFARNGLLGRRRTTLAWRGWNGRHMHPGHRVRCLALAVVHAPVTNPTTTHHHPLPAQRSTPNPQHHFASDYCPLSDLRVQANLTPYHRRPCSFVNTTPLQLTNPSWPRMLVDTLR